MAAENADIAVDLRQECRDHKSEPHNDGGKYLLGTNGAFVDLGRAADKSFDEITDAVIRKDRYDGENGEVSVLVWYITEKAHVEESADHDDTDDDVLDLLVLDKMQDLEESLDQEQREQKPDRDVEYQLASAPSLESLNDGVVPEIGLVDERVRHIIDSGNEHIRKI